MSVEPRSNQEATLSVEPCPPCVVPALSYVVLVLPICQAHTTGINSGCPLAVQGCIIANASAGINLALCGIQCLGALHFTSASIGHMLLYSGACVPHVPDYCCIAVHGLKICVTTMFRYGCFLGVCNDVLWVMIGHMMWHAANDVA